MRMLITGASGYFGTYAANEAKASGHELVLWSHKAQRTVAGQTTTVVDITNDVACRKAFEDAAPEVVIHAAALAVVRVCHENPKLARTVNVEATERLVGLALRRKAKVLFTSTDLVFSGEKGNYLETDQPDALSVYGRTKAEAERIVQIPNSIVVRAPLMYGPCLDKDSPRFFDQMVQSLREGKPITCFHDEWRTPLDMPTAAKLLLELIEIDFCGLIHMGGPEKLSRLDMGLRLAARLGGTPELVKSISRLSIPSSELRPKDTSLDSGKLETIGLATKRMTMTESLAKMKLG